MKEGPEYRVSSISQEETDEGARVSLLPSSTNVCSIDSYSSMSNGVVCGVLRMMTLRGFYPQLQVKNFLRLRNFRLQIFGPSLNFVIGFKKMFIFLLDFLRRWTIRDMKYFSCFIKRHGSSALFCCLL